MANLATELIRHGRISTTLSRAKTVQPLAEKMITFAKRGDVAARREVLKVIRDRDVVHKLFAEVGPAFAERNGGYTRVLKTGPRKGDAAPMALIELVEGVSVDGEGALEEKPARRWSLRRRRGGTASVSARQRQEERAAAIDRGDMPVHVHDEDEDVEEPVEEPVAAQPDEEGPQVNPAEVEARLAAEDEAAEAEDSGEDSEGSSDEADGDEPSAEDKPDSDQS